MNKTEPPSQPANQPTSHSQNPDMAEPQHNRIYRQYLIEGLFEKVEDSERSLDTFFKSAFEFDRLTLEDTYGYRTMTLYRILRRLVLLTGLEASPDRPLANAQTEKWTKPQPLDEYFYTTQKHLFSNLSGAADILRHQPVYLLPPPNTDPEDPLLQTYTRLLSEIANGLDIYSGSFKDPQSGMLGLRGLLEPELLTLPGVCPSIRDLLQVEEFLLDEACDYIIKKGRPFARKRLIDDYGFRKLEVDTILSMAINQAKNTYLSKDLEEARTIQTLRLENFIAKAQQQYSLRYELQAIKHLSTVLGITQVQPETALDQMLSSARRVINRQQLPEHQEPALLVKAEEILNEPEPTYEEVHGRD